jgi:alpha-tubulin suppressor-like RCC1 family protein
MNDSAKNNRILKFVAVPVVMVIALIIFSILINENEEHESDLPVEPNLSLNFDYRTIAGEGSNGLAVKSDGSLWAWGHCITPRSEYYHSDGAMRGHRKANMSLLTPVNIMDDVASVAVGNTVNFAVRTDGSLWAWGSNEFGQIGDGTRSRYVTLGPILLRRIDHDKDLPVKIMDDVVCAAAGGIHSLAVKTDGSLWAWGYNWYGQLGNGTRKSNNRPQKIMDDVVSVAASYYHSMALKSDGSLWAWGANASGTVGNGKSGFREDNSPEHSTIPEKIMENVAYIAAYNYAGAAVKTDGSLWIWGRVYEPFTKSDRRKITRPLKVMDDVAAVEIAGGYVLALKTDGSLWAWGRHLSSLFGEDFDSGGEPIKVFDDVVNISAKFGGGLAVKTDGSLWAVGGRSDTSGSPRTSGKGQIRFMEVGIP